MDDHNPLPYATNTIVALKIFYQPYDLTFANKAFFFFYFFASISKYHNLFNWSNNRSWVLIIIFLIMCSYSRGSYPMGFLSKGFLSILHGLLWLLSLMIHLWLSMIIHLWWSILIIPWWSDYPSLMIQLYDPIIHLW